MKSPSLVDLVTTHVRAHALSVFTGPAIGEMADLMGGLSRGAVCVPLETVAFVSIPGVATHHRKAVREALSGVFPYDGTDPHGIVGAHGVGAVRVWFAALALLGAPAGGIVLFPHFDTALYPPHFPAILQVLRTLAADKHLILGTQSKEALNAILDLKADTSFFTFTFKSITETTGTAFAFSLNRRG